MIEVRLAFTAVAGAALLAAMPSAAATMVAQYMGTLSSGLDQTGVFAAPNTNLTGYFFIATYTYDKTRGGTRYADYFREESAGGSSIGYPGNSPIISATLWINGVTRSITGTYYGKVYTNSWPYVEHRASDYSNDRAAYKYYRLFNYGSPSPAPTSLNQNYARNRFLNGYGEFGFGSYDYTTGANESAYGIFGPVMSYEVSGAVPEPATWALLIAGFGMVGGAMRRRAASVA